jgi:hypothetical protein
MSRIALREDGLLVLDAVLAAADFECLWRDIRKRDFRSVHAQKWDKAWRLCDGLPMRGESIYFDPKGAFGWKGCSYPTRTRLDLLIDAIRRASAAYPDVVGTEGVDWTAIYLAPWCRQRSVGSPRFRPKDRVLYFLYTPTVESSLGRRSACFARVVSNCR